MLYRLEPDRENSVEILVFRGVKNAKDVRLRMMKGEFSAAFLKAHLVRCGAISHSLDTQRPLALSKLLRRVD